MSDGGLPDHEAERLIEARDARRRELAQGVDSEGLDYAIGSYYSLSAIHACEDSDFAEWWTQARALLEKIRARLDEWNEE